MIGLALAAALTLGDGAVCHEESRVAMGCTWTVRACGPDGAEARGAASAALDEVDRLDRLLSHYKATSELSRVNREAARGPVAVDRELVEVLAVSLRWSRETDGAFDVTVGPLMAAWGFFGGDGRVPSAPELAAARARVGADHVVLDEAAGTVRFDRDGVSVDLGGIGKGYAVDRAVSVLRARGARSALVSAGGSSVYGLGAPPEAEAWTIDVLDPARPGGAPSRVSLRDRALSVAGRSVRSFEQDGVVYSHVMDPRTGRPVAGVAGVVVLSDDATSGDALDDALFVLGVEGGRRLLERHPDARAVLHLVDRRGRSRRVALP